jgi:hypothetical protein
MSGTSWDVSFMRASTVDDGVRFFDPLSGIVQNSVAE